MPDLQKLLDQIDRLDQEAEAGPWDHDREVNTENGWSLGTVRSHHTGESVTAEVYDADAEFIALARTALPQLAIALRAVMDCVADMEQDNGDDSAYSHGVRHMAGTVCHIITDTLKGDDDAG